MSAPPLRPTPDQALAADPAGSAWVSANAGSGKTRVLTHRVARLLLAGSPPERILCLTYTKAAAAEMQTRLFALLGGWAMAPDDRLAAELAALDGGGHAPPEPARLARARRLFAAALETPGGLKIQTIHAFCAGLLRRFPLEAGVSPRARLIDDRAAADLVSEARRRMAEAAEAGDDDAFDAVAGRVNEDDLDAIIHTVTARRRSFGAEASVASAAARKRLFGPAAKGDPAALARAALEGFDTGLAARLADVFERCGGKEETAMVGPLRAAASAGNRPVEAVSDLVDVLLTKTWTARKKVPTKAVAAADPGAGDCYGALAEWATGANDMRLAAGVAARAADLDRFATALLERYAALKRADALLDFDDLVARTRDLLTSAEMRAWVLFKLDAGIDHVLVDEAQDTAPAQWAVIRAITEEFHAGAGMRETRRTVFVVGDEKQSIYSFQGADPDAFGRECAALEERLVGAGAGLARPALATSYRAAAGLLDFVDEVFAGAATSLTAGGAPVDHVAHRSDDPGRVDLWPLVEPPERPERPDWFAPVDAPSPTSPKLVLADRLAGEIARMLAEDRLPPRAGQAERALHPGDILVLVRSRDLLARSLIRRLRQRGVPVAGADRLSLTEDIAVKDLLAVARVALNRTDDLSLAAVLRSPLCSVTEEALFALAHGRLGTLWQALAHAPAHAEDAAMLRDMADQADFLRPYEFLERLLIRHGGQRRLLARLGAEVADVIDELLAQAEAFETVEPPSLAGFLDWLDRAGVTVKREMDQGADTVRVMTIHGAKGLEAPVVILPDTMRREPGQTRAPRLEPVPDAPELTLWLGAAKTDDPVASRTREAAARRAGAESQRLLYVGLTRAEDWLILCGAGAPDKAGEGGRWYGQLAGAMERQGARAAELPGIGPIRRLGLPASPDRPVPGEAPRPAGTAGPAHTPPARDDRPGDGGSVPAAATGANARFGAPPAWLTRAPAEERPPRPTPSTLLAGEPALAAVVAALANPDAGGPPGGPPDGSAGVPPDGPRRGDGPAAALRDRAEALRHGEAVHLLLERLGGRPAAERQRLAPRLFASRMPDLDPTARNAALAEMEAVLAAPFAASVFGPGSRAEASVVLDLPGVAGPRMRGRIDRLVIGPDNLCVIDIKTDAAPPDRPEAVGAAYLAQIGAYRAALAAEFPDRRVEAALLWTATPALMEVPAALLDRVLAALPAPAPPA